MPPWNCSPTSASSARTCVSRSTALRTSSDIRLTDDGDKLLVVYSNDTKGITYVGLDYNARNGAWSVEETSEVTSFGIDADTTNPTIVEGGTGNLLVAYNMSTDRGVRGVLAGSQDGENWVKVSGLDPTAQTGALRVMATPDGFGGIYASKNEIFWVTLENNEWVYEKIADNGPVGLYATHFSTTTVGDDIFLASVSADNRITFLHYDGATKTWSDGVTPPSTVGDKVSSVQMSADTDGNIYLTYDDYDDGTLVVIKSIDEGDTWVPEAVLDVPRLYEQAPVRWFETPEHFDDELLVVSQFYFPGLDGFKGPNGLYHFVVDTDPSSSSAPAVAAASGGRAFSGPFFSGDSGADFSGLRAAFSQHHDDVSPLA